MENETSGPCVITDSEMQMCGRMSGTREVVKYNGEWH